MRRIFTRADVQAHFEKYWGKPDAVLVRQIEHIQLVTDMSCPLWALTYKTTYLGCHDEYHQTILFTQKTFSNGSPYIACCDEVELPVGCQTVREENAVLKGKKHVEEEQRQAVSR